MAPHIGLYLSAEAACHPYDPRAPEVARLVAEAITTRVPALTVEHIGSTSVAGCAGKGIVDLMVLYPPGQLEEAKAVLTELGFQPQSSRDPFPEDRPMRTGTVEHEGTIFPLHAHVIAADAAEATVLRQFRDRLRHDAELRAAYVGHKQTILASGITDAVDYSIAKGDFVLAALDVAPSAGNREEGDQ